jgi:tubulin monoglycylase TTLL3/8
VKEVLQHRARSHELYGYDFMVDSDLNVWLIEINSSPSMEYSTPITEKLVKQVMPQIVRIVIDHDHGNSTEKNIGDRIEDFELIYK